MKAEEQTPIERFSSGNGEGLYNDDNGYWVRFEDVEQYAELRIQQELQQEREKWKEETKKEVLKALEMEFSKVDISMFDEDRSSDYTEQGKFYYETQVKPRIESK